MWGRCSTGDGRAKGGRVREAGTTIHTGGGAPQGSPVGGAPGAVAKEVQADGDGGARALESQTTSPKVQVKKIRVCAWEKERNMEREIDMWGPQMACGTCL